MGTVMLKERPEDFLVLENLIAPRLSIGTSRFDYLIVRKMGVTTFDAIAAIATELDLSPKRIHYAGLKDEDGITEQMIAIEGPVPDEAIGRFNDKFRSGTCTIELRRYGRGDEAIEIGNLHGNSFRIVARNLSVAFAERARGFKRLPVYFLNYYDAQRFGVPHGPKTTHLIGEAILRGDYEAAFARLAESKSSESDRALAFRGAPVDFFAGLESRVISFYKSAYGSHLWNAALAEEVRTLCDGETYEDRHEGISFLMTNRQDLILAVLAKCPTLEYRRYYGEGGSSGKPALRATVIQTQVVCNPIAPDLSRPGTQACEFCFFLPAGCYATTFVRQMVNMVDL